MASVEVPYNMKEDRSMGVKGLHLLETVFDYSLQILGKRPFGHKGVSFSRLKIVVALAISMLPSNVSILLQI